VSSGEFNVNVSPAILEWTKLPSFTKPTAYYPNPAPNYASMNALAMTQTPSRTGLLPPKTIDAVADAVARRASLNGRLDDFRLAPADFDVNCRGRRCRSQTPRRQIALFP